MATLIPLSACAEALADPPESTMFPVEARAIGHAAAERRREFGAVRHCARRALRKIGFPGAAIVPDADGAPRWPVGAVGSMTHCPGYRAAVVARSRDHRSVGIDAEPHNAIPGDVFDLVVTDEERPRLEVLATCHPHLHWDRLLFCVKEAVFKAWFPLTRRWLDFSDLSVALGIDGTFRAEILAPRPRDTGFGPDRFRGQWRVGHGLICAATAVPARVGEELAGG